MTKNQMESLTKRELFAAFALAGEMMEADKGTMWSPAGAAMRAVQAADALMKQLTENTPKAR